MGGVIDGTPTLRRSLSISSPPLPRSPSERFDPYSVHHIPSPGAYEPRLFNQRNAALPNELSLSNFLDDGLRKMVVDSTSDSPAASFGAENSSKSVTRRRVLHRGSLKRKNIGKNLKESAGIV
ncbi:hypothetical protein IV203_023977 [Nitzschia inconspicua]|uniref:Uncharacterized protein n=1 Tax=Nitzschia inconspicua TaxID=303405 RepID=A0A9K3P9D1_9STRA|nr:hypothetical protein IV203_024498 [Nitzschia inconspicua]KAG7340434.1 hypothetical protein IV203_023977 [Nitzschia inconspicua]